MSAEDELETLRAIRDADRATLADHLASARPLANPTILVNRARAELEDKARSATMQAVEIANDNRGVVVGTVAALALWALRHKIGQAAMDGVDRMRANPPRWLNDIAVRIKAIRP